MIGEYKTNQQQRPINLSPREWVAQMLADRASLRLSHAVMALHCRKAYHHTVGVGIIGRRTWESNKVGVVLSPTPRCRSSSHPIFVSVDLIMPTVLVPGVLPALAKQYLKNGWPGSRGKRFHCKGPASGQWGREPKGRVAP